MKKTNPDLIPGRLGLRTITIALVGVRLCDWLADLIRRTEYGCMIDEGHSISWTRWQQARRARRSCCAGGADRRWVVFGCGAVTGSPSTIIAVRRSRGSAGEGQIRRSGAGAGRAERIELVPTQAPRRACHLGDPMSLIWVSKSMDKLANADGMGHPSGRYRRRTGEAWLLAPAQSQAMKARSIRERQFEHINTRWSRPGAGNL